MYKRILITTDGSDSNRIAIEEGLRLAKIMDATVTVLCVFDIGSYANAAQGYAPVDDRDYMIQQAEGAIDYVRKIAEPMGVKIVPKVITGRPADAIISESENQDLVVCGSLGRTGLSRALLGSVAERVVRMAHCPVLVCRSAQ